jgi:hypothetical protein
MSGTEGMSREHERVSAYLGGTMTSQEASAFEQELKDDLGLAAVVERWQGNDAFLKQAFATPDATDISDALLARLGLTETAASDNVVAIDSFRRPNTEQNDNSVSPKWRWPMVASIAASLVVALAVGNLLLTMPAGIASEATFQTAMNNSTSGVAVALNDTQTLTPILSFEARDGRFCREFALKDKAESNQGITCKTGDQWTIEALVNGGKVLPSSSEIRTAAGNEGATLDTFYSRLGAGDPVDRSTEEYLILRGWTKK